MAKKDVVSIVQGVLEDLKELENLGNELQTVIEDLKSMEDIAQKSKELDIVQALNQEIASLTLQIVQLREENADLRKELRYWRSQSQQS